MRSGWHKSQPVNKSIYHYIDNTMDIMFLSLVFRQKYKNTLEIGPDELEMMSVDEILPFPLIFSFLSLAVTASSTLWIPSVFCSFAVVEEE